MIYDERTANVLGNAAFDRCMDTALISIVLDAYYLLIITKAYAFVSKMLTRFQYDT